MITAIFVVGLVFFAIGVAVGENIGRKEKDDK